MIVAPALRAWMICFSSIIKPCLVSESLPDWKSYEGNPNDLKEPHICQTEIITAPVSLVSSGPVVRYPHRD